MSFLGAVFVLNLALGPVVLNLSRATSKEFFSKFWPGMTRFLHASIGGTALFGILLYLGGDFHTLAGNPGAYLDAGIALAVLAIIEGEAIQIPAVNRLLKLVNQGGGAGAPEPQSYSADELKMLGRIKAGGIIGVLTITLAAILMIAAAT